MALFNPSELERLEALKSYNILDSEVEADFDALTLLAAELCNVPIAAISLVDSQRQWFKSQVGLNVCETSREVSFCTHAIHYSEPFIVTNAKLHPQFANNPLVINSPYITSYIGIPLISSTGHALGTLCCIDDKPREFSKSQIAGLVTIGKQIMLHFEARRQHFLQQQQSLAYEKLTAMADEKHELLEALAKGANQNEIFKSAIHLVERHLLGNVACIMLLDADKTQFVKCTAVSLPEVYTQQLIKLNVSNNDSPCAASVNTQKMVTISNMAEDLHYPEFCQLALPQQLQSCWALPIFGNQQQVLGVFTLFASKPCTPSQHETALANTCAKAVGMAIEHHQAQESMELLRTCVEKQNDIVIITKAEPVDKPGPYVVYVNNAFERQTGYSKDEIIGKTPRILQGQDTDKNETDRVNASLKKWQSVRTELLNYKKNGDAFWHELEITPVANEDGWFTHWVGIGRDVTQRKKSEEMIKHLAFYDALTALPNRRLLIDRLTQVIIANARNNIYGALLFLDLDHFKNLNDTAGHLVGDLLLEQVAKRLQSEVREEDTVARMGGDEFVVMLKALGCDAAHVAGQVHTVTQKLQDTFKAPFLIDGQHYFITASIGIRVFNGADIMVDDLLKSADLAMYQAKAEGRNTIRFFEEEMQTAMAARTQAEHQLRLALENNQLILHYQAQYNSLNQIIGAEVLLRWIKHGEMIGPNEFIPLAEETGLIVPIGEWVIRTACLQLVNWQKIPQLKHLLLSVNVSVKQFMHDDFVESVLEAIKSTGANPELLILEMTESLFVQDVKKITAKISQLRQHGIKFSLDDFGVGYSSLTHLRRLPLDQIKIDKSFVQEMIGSKVDLAIVKSVIELAKNLKIPVIAEGVETEAQRRLLEAYGCYNYQGYLFSRPIDLAQFEDLLLNHNS